MSGTLTIGGMTAGLPGGQGVIGPVTTTGSTAIGTVLDVTLNSGDNTLTVPTGATSVAIFLGQSPSATVKVRTNLNISDGGLQIAPSGVTSWAKFELVTGATSVVLNSNASLSNVEIRFI